jgi:hypothetical protein
VNSHVTLRRGLLEYCTRAELHGALAGLDGGERRLVVHFHGGLVKREAGLATAERLGRVYEAAGAYPLSIVWQSGIGETIASRLAAVSRERLFQRLLARVLQVVARPVRPGGARGITLSPIPLRQAKEAIASAADGEPYEEPSAYETAPLTPLEEQQLELMIRGDAVVERESRRIAEALAGGAGLARTAEPITYVEQSVQRRIAGRRNAGDRSALGATVIAARTMTAVKRVLARLAGGRGHGVYTTVVEELLRALYLTQAGAGFWRQMKQDSTDAFGTDELCGGTALVEELAKRTGSPPVLVGHSAGAIWVCRLLAHADSVLPDDRRFDVVLLAPACDFDLADRTLARLSHRIRRLRVFSMKDDRERVDRLLPGVYPRSLLYLVSGVLEPEPDWPLLGMERFHTDARPFTAGAFPQIDAVRSALGAIPDSLVWSIAADGNGLTSSAVHHGDFDDDHATLESVQHIIAAR